MLPRRSHIVQRLLFGSCDRLANVSSLTAGALVRCLSKGFADRMSALRLDVLRPLLTRSARYYFYQLISIFLGTLYFSVLVSLLSIGIGMIIFWVGLLILLLTMGASWYFARLERNFTVRMLDAEIPPLATPDSRDNSTFQRLKTHVTNPLTWKSMMYLLIKLPYSVTTVFIVSLLLGMVLDGLTVPFIYPWAGNQSIVGGIWNVSSFAGALLKFAFAFPLLIATYFVNEWLNRFWRMFAEYMLSQAPAAESTPQPRPVVSEVPIQPAPGAEAPTPTMIPVRTTATTPPAPAPAMPDPEEPTQPTRIEPATVPPVEPDSVVIEELTEREAEVLGLLAQGLSNREIADRIYVTEGTVKRHTHNIYRKLGASNRTQAVAIGRQAGLLVDADPSSSDSTA